MSANSRSARFVIDTHVLIWYFTGNKRLSSDLIMAIDQARQQGGSILVPTIVLAEALVVSIKGRVVFDFEQLYTQVLTEPEFRIVGFDADIFDEALRIQRIPEIHDRIIVATARFYDVSLLTKDGVILLSDEVNLS